MTKGSPSRDHVGVMRFAPLPPGRTHLEYRTRVAAPVKGALRRNVTKGLAKVDAGA